jgi:Bacterial self-protective colicin-like immunity
MNTTALSEMMSKFVRGSLDAPSFAKSYQAAWRLWRDAGQPTNLDIEVFDRAFTAADAYLSVSNPISEAELRSELDRLRSQLPEISN